MEKTFRRRLLGMPRWRHEYLENDMGKVKKR
jgi:hypothetical protein